MAIDARDGAHELLAGLHALTNPHRFEALRLLREPAAHFRPQAAGAPEEVGVCVSDLQEKLGLSQSTTSQYLAVLERAKLATSRRLGQWTYWQSNGPEIEAVVNFLAAALVPQREGPPPSPMDLPSPLRAQDVFAARARIRSHVRHTPLEPSSSLSRITGGSVLLKWENLQFTRSCKPRGIFNRLLQLTPEEHRAGILTAAAGNHALGLAYAGAQLRINVHAFLPEAADPEFVRSIRDLGAKVTFRADQETASQAAQRASREDGRVYLAASADPAMIAGGGTIALELLDDLPEMESVAVCAISGGLVSGMGLVLKAVRPDLRVYAVQPTLARGHGDGQPAPFKPNVPLVSALTSPLEPTTRNFPLLPRCTDGVMTVSEEALRSAMQWAWEEHRLAVEPSGAAALAWVLSNPPELRGRRTAAIVTGGNVSSADFRFLLRP
jgi:threonine dehydratase